MEDSYIVYVSIMLANLLRGRLLALDRGRLRLRGGGRDAGTGKVGIAGDVGGVLCWKAGP